MPRAGLSIYWPTVSGGADSVDELCPSGFESLAVTGDRWGEELAKCKPLAQERMDAIFRAYEQVEALPELQRAEK